MELSKGLSNMTWFYNKPSSFGNSNFCKRETSTEYENNLSFFVWVEGCYWRNTYM